MHAARVSYFNFRIKSDLPMGEHISRLEYIIRSNILHLFSDLFIVEFWYNTVFVYNVPFCSQPYGITASSTFSSNLHQSVSFHMMTSSNGHIFPFFAGNSQVTNEFPLQGPVTRSFDVFFDLRPNKRLSKQL